MARGPTICNESIPPWRPRSLAEDLELSLLGRISLDLGGVSVELAHLREVTELLAMIPSPLSHLTSTRACIRQCNGRHLSLESKLLRLHAAPTARWPSCNTAVTTPSLQVGPSWMPGVWVQSFRAVS